MNVYIGRPSIHGGEMMETAGHMKVIDVNERAAAASERWVNFTLTRVNDCLVRMGVFEGEFHWHLHDLEDEFFFVVSGRLLLDLKGRTVGLAPGQGFTVPRGVEHRTRAEARTVVLMVEGATVKPGGDRPSRHDKTY